MKKILDFIRKRPHLVWYVEDPLALNRESIVEHTLNSGDWDDVRKLMEILGVRPMAKIFRRQTARERCNYYPATRNYFTRYFKKYA